jgi:hypothetical protein
LRSYQARKSASREDDRRQQITKIAITAMMTRAADQFDGYACVNSFHDSRVETMQIICHHADGSLLFVAHGLRLICSAGLDVWFSVHDCVPSFVDFEIAALKLQAVGPRLEGREWMLRKAKLTQLLF